MDGDGKRRTEIDAVKGVAIIAVILGHAFSYALTEGSVSSAPPMIAPQSLSLSHILSSWITYSSLTTQQAVPVFIILLAINYANSFRRRGYTRFDQMYSWNHFKTRLTRYIVPFVLIYIVTLAVIAVLLLTTGINYLFLNPLLLIGYLPVNGLGNYFIPLVFEFLFIFPLVFFSFQKRPFATILITFIIGLANEFVFSGAYLAYQNSILRFLPLIGVGIWISDDLRISSKKNQVTIVLGILGLVYLMVISQFTTPFSFMNIYFIPTLSSQKFFAAFYVALIVLILLAVFRQLTRISSASAYLGRSSYTIFLFQILFFGSIAPKSTYSSPWQLLSLGNLAILGVDLATCIVMGILLDMAAGRVIAFLNNRPSQKRT